MLSSIVKLSFFLLSTAILHVSGLYEDQVGKFDWTQRYIGKIENWDQSNLATGLHKNVQHRYMSSMVLAINKSIETDIKDNDRGTIDAVFHQDKYFVGVCGGGRYVRSWKVETGALSWENTVHHIARPGADIKIKGNDTDKNEEVTPIQKLREKGSWKPPKSKNDNLESFINYVRSEIKPCITNKGNYNLSKSESIALKASKEEEDIVIKPADKGALWLS
ncbi:EMC1 [Mytilus edulis]|uniref:EMC1 n=1 Tax=Mytilus edulis TaxID=6550 RepID=A0A8S3V9S4_MYTED|nr:EMC1 [Mytilus edulis]